MLNRSALSANVEDFTRGQKFNEFHPVNTSFVVFRWHECYWFTINYLRFCHNEQFFFLSFENSGPYSTTLETIFLEWKTSKQANRPAHVHQNTGKSAPSSLENPAHTKLAKMLLTLLHSSCGFICLLARSLKVAQWL